MPRKKNNEKDELTTEMHSEFQISEEDDQKFATWTALDVIESGAFSKEEAMKEYGVSAEDLERYRKEWEELSGGIDMLKDTQS